MEKKIEETKRRGEERIGAGSDKKRVENGYGRKRKEDER